MIVSDVIMRVRRVFGDEAAVQIKDDDIIRWINDAQIAIVMNNDSALQASGFIDLVANQAQYTLPIDLLILRALRYKTTAMNSYYRLRYVNMQQFDESIDGWDGTTYSTSNPAMFTMYEGKAILFPIPDSSATNGIKVLYNKVPTDVVLTSDALSVPLIYHNTVYKYCMAQASLLDEDFESAARYRGDFQDDARTLSQTENQDPNATYSTITTLEFDM